MAKDIKAIEMVTPMVRPYGCYPKAPLDWVSLRTYAKILVFRVTTQTVM